MFQKCFANYYYNLKNAEFKAVGFINIAHFNLF